MVARVFDHLTIRVSDRAASERFYRTVLSTLAIETTSVEADFVEWTTSRSRRRSRSRRNPP